MDPHDARIWYIDGTFTEMAWQYAWEYCYDPDATMYERLVNGRWVVCWSAAAECSLP